MLPLFIVNNVDVLLYCHNKGDAIPCCAPSNCPPNGMAMSQCLLFLLVYRAQEDLLVHLAQLEREA